MLPSVSQLYSASEYDLHQTIQNRMLRSESSLHFQPQWLDPHLSDYYHRPDFSHLEQLHQQQQQQMEQQHQHPYQKHHGGAISKKGVAGASNHSPSSHENPAATSSSLAPPPASGPYGHTSKYSPNAKRFSSSALVPPDVLSSMNARRNSIGGANGQMYAHLIGQGFGGSTNSINRPSTGGGNSNGLAFFRTPRGSNSNRSSCNSLYTYPANFNQGIEIPMNRLGGGKHGPRSGSVEDGKPVEVSGAGQSGVSITISSSASHGDLQVDKINKEASSSPDSGNASPSTSGVSNLGYQPDEPTATSNMEDQLQEENERL